MSDEKKINFISKILSEYKTIFDIKCNQLIDTIYEDLINENWYKENYYKENYYEEDYDDEAYFDYEYEELKELTSLDIINMINKSSNLKELLEDVYDGSYTYDWGRKIYKSMLEQYTEYGEVLSIIEAPFIGQYIEDNYAEKFESMFEQELEEYYWNDTYELVEGYINNFSDKLGIYEDYILNPEYIVEELLENQKIDKGRIIYGKIKNDEKNIKISPSILEAIIKLEPTKLLLSKLETIILDSYIIELSKFIGNEINSSIINNKNIENVTYEYKCCDSIYDFLKLNNNYFEKLFIRELKERKIIDNIYNSIIDKISLDEIRKSMRKIQHEDLEMLLKNRIGKEYIEGKLTISEKDVIEYLNKLVIEKVKNSIENNSHKLMSLNLYDFYKKGCKLLNVTPLFTIEKLNFKNEYLEEKLYKIFKNISNLYLNKSLNINIKSQNLEKLISEIKITLNKELYEKPKVIEKMINKYLKYIGQIGSYLSNIDSKDDNYKSVMDINEEIVNKLSNLQAYVLYEELSSKSYDINYDEISNYELCLKEIIKTNFKHMLNSSYITENIKTQLRDTLSDNPKDEFPLARSIKRHFIINVGDTNTGKTYNAINRLKENVRDGGVYLAPLRLLALEIQEKLNKENIPCSLYTGEEEDIVEGAKHECLTVEKANLSKRYDVCVIDECQMIGDSQRGFAWTNAILGIYCNEIHLCTAPEALELLIKLIEDCNDTWEVIEHERQTPLIVEQSSYRLPSNKHKGSLEKGDALIVFSKKQVLIIAEQLKSKGISTSIIYGSLPYKSRKRQFERFINGETDVLISTDAIGMGVSIPIKRIIFLETKKFDGKEFRELNVSEVKQIAGRAGRRGYYPEGFVNATFDKNKIETKLNSQTPIIKQANIIPSKSIININKDLLEIIKVWESMQLSDLYKKGDLSRMKDIINRLHNYKDVLTKEDIYNATTLPFDEKNKDIYKLFKQYINEYIDREDTLSKPKLNNNPILDELEEYYKKLDLYYAFSNKFNMKIDLEWLEKEKSNTSKQINNMIINNIGNLKKKCPQCGKKLDFTWQHKLCDSCFRKNNDYWYY